MADNVAVTPGSGAVVLADELTDGVLGTGVAQMMKVMDGTLGSSNKAIVNSLGEFATYEPDTVVTGTITTTDIVVGAPAGAGAFVTGASTAGSLVFALSQGGDATWTVQITGLTTGTLYFEASADSTTGTDGNWINVNARRVGLLTTTIAANATANGFYRGNASGIKYFRVRSVGTLTGTPALIIHLGDGADAVFINDALPLGTNTIGAVQLGSSTGKTTQKALGVLVTTAVTADQVIATVTVTTGKTFYIVGFDVTVYTTTVAATILNYGAVSLELPSGTKVWTQQMIGPGVDRIQVVVNESLFGTTAQVVRLVVTPAATTSFTWRGSIVGIEK